jgi:hypothetical protein
MADPNSPLKDLYAGDGSSSVMTYPHDLGSSRKGHFITFSVLSPTKSTYGSQSSSGASSVMSNPTSMVSNAQTTMNSAATTATSAVSGVTSAVKTAATVANQALSAANQAAASAASIVGVVAGAKSIISGSLSSGTVGGTLSGLASLSILSDTATSIPGVSSFLKDPMAAASGTWDSIKNFINNPLKSGSSSAASGFSTNSGNPKFSSPVMKPTGYINLYMPDTVSLSQHASYNDISLTDALGAAGAAAEGYRERADFGKNLSSLYDGLAAAGKNGSLPDAIKTIKDVDNPLMLEAAGKGLGSAGIVNNGTAVSQYLLKNKGYAINPQMEVIFTQMDFRRFQFDFTFTPKTAAESKTVRDIIKSFRLNAAPNLHGGGGRYFDIPSVFQIEYMHLGKRNENLHKFAPCVLETIMVDYAPEVGWVTYEDGMPVKTRLTLQFKETEIMTKEKIEHQGY